MRILTGTVGRIKVYKCTALNNNLCRAVLEGSIDAVDKVFIAVNGVAVGFAVEEAVIDYKSTLLNLNGCAAAVVGAAVDSQGRAISYIDAVTAVFAGI